LLFSKVFIFLFSNPGGYSMATHSKVFFTDMQTKHHYNLLDKFERLLTKANISKIDFIDKFTAIKLHFGEPGNLGFVRPNYARKVVDKVRELGGKPFLTDSNVLYWGKRGNAIDHILSAHENGFNPLATGANVIIADGLTGKAHTKVPVNLKHIKEAKIGSVIFDADIIISLTHFKGHIAAGFGGTLKNIGMGCGSRQGKMEMHSEEKPNIDKEMCVACGACIKYCPEKAISYNVNHKAQINYDKCIGCGQCVVSCHYGAAQGSHDGDPTVLNEKMAEYTYAALKDKQAFHISMIMNVSPDCDCFGFNDRSIVPDIGMAASFDPIALDRACVDLVNAAPLLPGGSIDSNNWKEGTDKFNHIHPNSHWQAALDHGEAIGLGSQKYELIQFE
jgi:uncharacterized protein